MAGFAAGVIWTLASPEGYAVWFRRKSQQRTEVVVPVEVKSVLADADHAYEVGLVAGMPGESIEQAMVTVHWRDVIRADREATSNHEGAGSPDGGPHRAGEAPPGAHRPAQT